MIFHLTPLGSNQCTVISVYTEDAAPIEMIRYARQLILDNFTVLFITEGDSLFPKPLIYIMKAVSLTCVQNK